MPQAKSPIILALDQGTTSSRALLFDAAGSMLATARQDFRQYFPQPGWVEHNPEDIAATQLAVIAEVLQRGRREPRDIAAIGLANQRETTLLWNRQTGEPVARAIVWQDRRTAPLCETLRAQGFKPEIVRRTGLLLDPYFSATKLGWLLESIPGARAGAERGDLAFGTVDTWLIWHLTQGSEHVIDETNASRTLLFNLQTRDWDEWLLALFKIPRACLPRIVSSRLDVPLDASILGHTVPLGGIAGDQHAALFGQGCFTAGMAKNTYGTGCFALLHTGERAVRSKHRLLTTIACRSGHSPVYALEGSVFVAGAAVQWLRDGLGIISTSAEIESLASSVPDSGGVSFVPAFTGLGSPHWDPDARGLVTGLTRGTTRAHLARAALDAIALQSTEVLLAMQRDAGFAITELRVDGGASVNNLLLQIQADLLGLPVVRPRITETTALGAAYLAGLSVGFWDSTETIARQRRIERVFEPQIGRDEAQSRLSRWSDAVRRARGSTTTCRAHA